MLNDRWPETERGTVVRRYFHARGANREMQAAQQEGWKVQEVKLNGSVVPDARDTNWWRRPWTTRLVRQTDRTVQLRTRSSGGWEHPGRSEQDIEITYLR